MSQTETQNKMDKIQEHTKAIEKLVAKRQRAFLYGRNKRMLALDRQISELELELDSLVSSH